MHPDRYSLACGSQPRRRVRPPVGTGAAGPVVRQSLSNFRPRLGGLCPVFSFPVFSYVLFYVIFYIHFTPSTIVSCLRCFSRFQLRFIFAPQVRIFQKFFFFLFRPSLLLVAVGACFCAVTEGGHYSGSRGVDHPLDPGLPHTLVRPCAFTAPASARSRV